MQHTIRIALALAAIGLSATLARAATLDPDELPKEEIELPNGAGKVWTIRYLSRNWKLTTPDILLAKDIRDTDDVCFEAKISHLDGKNVILFQQQGKIVCLDDVKIKEIKTYQRMDNIWICGKLRQPKGVQEGVELVLVDIARLPEDMVLCKNRLKVLEAKKDAEGLIELGYHISNILAVVINNFNQNDQFLTLRTEAWTKGLTFKEQQLPKDDVDGMYALSEKWVELLRKSSKRNELILKILKIDPEHRKASRIAKEEMGLVKVQETGKWVTPEERERIKAEQDLEIAKLDAEKRAALEAKKRLREDAVKERAQLLVKYQTAIRTAQGAKEIDGAIESLGKAIQGSMDPRFGRQGVDVLSSIAYPAAVYPGLDLASKSEFPEVRRDVYATLAWRGGENALKTLSHALRKESELGVVKSGVESLVRRGDRPALETLIECLQSDDSKVQTEVVEGLKAIARSNLASKDEWLKWWEANKERKDLLPKNNAQ